MSNALEDTSIKNWLIQWNRAETGARASFKTPIEEASLTVCKKKEVIWEGGGEELLTQDFFDFFSNKQTIFSEQILKAVSHGLNLYIPFLAYPALTQWRV